MNLFKKTNINDRPYEKVITFGPSVLTDAELLAIFIRSGYKDKSCMDIALNLLESNDGNGLLKLINKDIVELSKYDGIGKVKAIQLSCLLELSKRIWKQKKFDSLVFSSAEVIADFYMEEMRHLSYEKTKLLLLNKKCALIKEIDLSKGTVDSALISCRDIFIKALKYEAVNIILVHNHPSGDPNPSQSDLMITDKVNKASKMMEVALLDHIIIGDNSFYSFAMQGYI